jgi:hypothetical protein
MKDFWLLGILQRKQMKQDYAKVREQVKKTGDFSWDDDDYWRNLEDKIMAKVDATEIHEGENRAWAPWARIRSRKMTASKLVGALPFFALVLCSLLVSTGAMVATPNMQPNFKESISDSTERIEDTQYVLTHQDPSDFLMDVASRRTDPIDNQVVR